MSDRLTTDNAEMAATLMCNGQELLDVIRENPNDSTCTFAFAASDESSAVVTAFVMGASRVEPRAYSAHVRALMGMIRRKLESS